jgi:predicted CoA-binding protein
VTRLAAVGEIEAGGQSRLEHGLSSSHADGPAVRLYADGVVVGCQGNGTCVRVKIVPTRDHAKDRSVFTNPSGEQIDEFLRSTRVIAVVGLSADPTRPSHGVARSLQRFGYRIIPVTPGAEAILGETAVPDLAHLPDVLGPGEQVDVVDVFRRPEHVAAIVDECIRLKLPALWLQDGVIDEVAAERARAAGIFTVMDRCLYRDRAALR